MASFQHIPVLLEEIIELLDLREGSAVVDCTVGLAGHAKPIAEKLGSTGLLVGLDLDSEALEIANDRLKRLKESPPTIRLVNRNFAQLREVLSELAIRQVDAIFADLGVCSLQFENAQRGFSFQNDGPLDMRMDLRQRRSAADVVNSLHERQLADLLYEYGQETASRKIARLICQVRRKDRIDSTAQLAEIVCRALNIRHIPGRRRIHPATRTFQALRIAVNRELENLAQLLAQATALLRPGGRIAIISFHSLEDGIVKDDFRLKAKEGLYTISVRKPTVPTDSEVLRNPRSRSAKLRWAVRTDKLQASV